MHKALLIIFYSILVFLNYAGFGMFYSWFYGGMLYVLIPYLLVVALMILRILKLRKEGKEEKKKRAHIILMVTMLLPIVAAFVILVIAFSAMAIYG